MFTKLWNWFKNKIKSFNEKKGFLTFFVLVLMVGVVYYGFKVNLEQAGTFKILAVSVVFGFCFVYLIERFLFPGWNLHVIISKLYQNLDEFINGIKEKNIAAGYALMALAIITGIVILSIAIVVSAIVSKFLPSL